MLIEHMILELFPGYFKKLLESDVGIPVYG
jgi:hypothetical protein